jgi:hypothetical protein
MSIPMDAGQDLNAEAPKPKSHAELVTALRALRLPGDVSVWVKLAHDAARVLDAGDLGPTDMRIALFDTQLKPTWEQAGAFVDTVIDCLCPHIRNVPDLHWVDRDVTRGEVLRRNLDPRAARPSPRVRVEVVPYEARS